MQMRYTHAMQHDDPTTRPAPPGWLDAMAESDADLAAGRIVSAAAVHAGLTASIERMERQAAARRTSSPPAKHRVTTTRP